ncbi:hypothetical protein AeNC1_012449 [Aphanomyces euteiches]|nr:hypothetical protein AeNC1_012449 [Aphanomyces euteiches]
MIANATKINAIKDDFIDIQKYAIHYCNRDVDVLHKCFEAFRMMVINRFNIDVYRFMSMPSIAYAIQHNQGCFDGCFEQNGIVLGFIRQAIVGGRVMTQNNKKHHVKHQLADFDAVSLYPSGQSILPGYIKGKAKYFKDSIPEKADYYIARVRFDSIGKYRNFPLLSIQHDGSRNFTNDITGETMIIGKQALEDIVEFQDVKYTIIEDVVKESFEERLKLKKEGNPLQEGIKLLLNSAYGKLIQKPIVKEKLLVKGADKIKEYTQKKIHKMISRTLITDNLALFEEHKYLYEHYSPAHLGVQILDSSKHIMNEVMCLAEDIEANIWYQDTDSMHIDRDEISKLADAFRDKYGRELIGNQFHSDFELEGSQGEGFAKESIFLGKKSYLDVLTCEGNDVEGHHIRMKGIPGALLQQNPYEAYLKLFDGESMEFDLAQCCSIDINTKTQRVTKRLKFMRKVSF